MDFWHIYLDFSIVLLKYFMLTGAGFDEGFGTALVKVTVNKEVPFGLRQIS